MKNAAPKAIAVNRLVEHVMRQNRGRLLAGLITRLGDFQLAEDALQEASVSALKHWGRSGPPHDPVAWLMKVSFRKGIDLIRDRQRELRKSDAIRIEALADAESKTPQIIPDERLRLIFACCHPTLEEKSRVALTLRTVCGLTTREIAAAFLDSEQTMGQRLSRAKAKIKSKGLCFAVPEPEEWDTRLGTVLSTLYLIFTSGYVNEDTGPRDLCKEGIFLARLLNELRPNEAEIKGALALMLLTDARRPARVDVHGAIVPVEDQDHRLWPEDIVAEARKILENAVRQLQPGPFQIKAAIADCHMARPTPDWPQMALLYGSLWAFEPTPVVALNWAVVLAETGQAELALQRLDELQSSLSNFQPWYAARAHILEKLGRTSEAHTVYQTAIQLAPNDASRKFLSRKVQAITI